MNSTEKVIYKWCDKINLLLLNHGYSCYVKLDGGCGRITAQLWNIPEDQKIRDLNLCMRNEEFYAWISAFHQGLRFGLKEDYPHPDNTLKIGLECVTPRQVEQIAWRVVGEAIDGLRITSVPDET